MKTITVYEVDGKRFDREEDARAYEHLCQRVSKAMSVLKPRTKEVEDGLAYIEHDKEAVKIAFAQFMGICADVIPDWKEWFEQVAKGERHISHAGRIIGDVAYKYPILSDVFFRFNCINFEHGYEFQQPYYATHIDEAFKDIKMRNEYLNKNE